MSDSEDADLLQFHQMALDERILKAIVKLGWKCPTLIQEKSIPMALEGKDILARARTGSGKTAAYLVPIVQRVLAAKQVSSLQQVRSIILAPSKELCQQIFNHCQHLISCCNREVSVLDLSGQSEVSAHRPLLSDRPDIVIGTPSRVLAHLKAQTFDVRESLQTLAVDEADLLFTFGFESDVRAILGFLPNVYQAFLMSATLGDDVLALKKLLLHNPVTLKLNEPDLPIAGQLDQYHIKCSEEDKFVLIYTLLKLNLIRGKSIIFVNKVDRCYRLKLYLGQFGINSCIINAELPVNCRCHIMNQFNSGLFDIIIASDDKTVEEEPTSSKDGKERRHAKRHKGDKEYSVARGIDFQLVSNVINFDFPPDVDSYVHRVGRTARGSNSGTALSFVTNKELQEMEDVKRALSLQMGSETIFKPYQFQMEEVESFRYRARDAMRAVTKVAIRESRLLELKQELLASKKLKNYFADNPRDFQLLRHDRTLHTVRPQTHLQNVPDYIVPEALKGKLKKLPQQKKRKGSGGKKWMNAKGNQRKSKRSKDPLHSFVYKRTNRSQ